MKPKPLVVTLDGIKESRRLFRQFPDGMKSGMVVLNPGESVGEHNTEEKEEAIMVIEGTAKIFCENSEPMTAVADSVSYIPPQTKHNVQNSGNEILRYVYITAHFGGEAAR